MQIFSVAMCSGGFNYPDRAYPDRGTSGHGDGADVATRKYDFYYL
ncbi:MULTISPECIES: hypothetical protein [Planktothricoides]|uniref:Uncharacterized protein n=1 Tax=Planktothricoides raciborskii GIHE-MW2 TaxID=2792601 RepID=A0AAU8JNL6_9CYAN|nr:MULTISPECIES: hypothetical protein [Planktothricoides]